MPNSCAIQYQNLSDDSVSDVLVFTQNRKANLDALPPVAWQVITNIGFNGFHNFVYTVDTQVSLTWEGGASGILPSEVLEGGVYSLNLVDRDFEFTRSGVTLGNEIDVWNNVHTPNGIDVPLIKDGKPIMTQPGVGYGSQGRSSA